MRLGSMPSARPLRMAILVVVGVLQLAVPAWMIVGRERTLAEGNPWRFRTAPVDPADAFRGRYLALAFDERSAPVPEGMVLERGERVFVPLEEDRQGFAKLGPVRRQPPAEGDYLRLRARWIRDREGEGRVALFDLPFDRLYLEEGLAPAVERAFRDRTRGEGLTAWALVRVREGRAVLEDVLVEGESIRALAGNETTGGMPRRSNAPVIP